MPDDTRQRASLAYRKAQAEIWAGRVPEKYTRLLPFIPRGGRALEIGAAEGVLALLLARARHVEQITGLEWRTDRHEEGLRLSAQWGALGHDVSRCTLVCGDIRARLDLLAGVDTLIAVRTLYYLREEAAVVLRAAAVHRVDTIVLGGNRGRQAVARATPTSALGQFNRLASVEGMRAALEAAGYTITTVVDEGDPIVVGRLSHRA